MLALQGKHVRVCHGLCPCPLEATGPRSIFVRRHGGTEETEQASPVREHRGTGVPRPENSRYPSDRTSHNRRGLDAECVRVAQPQEDVCRRCTRSSTAGAVPTGRNRGRLGLVPALHFLPLRDPDKRVVRATRPPASVVNCVRHPRSRGSPGRDCPRQRPGRGYRASPRCRHRSPSRPRWSRPGRGSLRLPPTRPVRS